MAQIIEDLRFEGKSLVFYSQARAADAASPGIGTGTPDLLSVAQDEQAVDGIIHVHEGLDSLFLALGPPPEDGLSESEWVGSGSGGTVL